MDLASLLQAILSSAAIISDRTRWKNVKSSVVPNDLARLWDTLN